VIVLVILASNIYGIYQVATGSWKDGFAPETEMRVCQGDQPQWVNSWGSSRLSHGARRNNCVINVVRIRERFQPWRARTAFLELEILPVILLGSSENPY
jgi:hypothetical protein